MNPAAALLPVAVSETETNSKRKVVDLVLQSLGEVPKRPPNTRGRTERRTVIPNNEPVWPPKSWARSPRRQYWVVDDPILTPPKNSLNISLRNIEPKTREYIFQTSLDVPKLVAVSWPEEIRPAKGAEVPYLVYFRPVPNTGSDRWGPSYIGAPNLVGPDGAFYPFGFDFLYYEFWSYLNYRSDPLTYREERWRPSRSILQRAGAPGLTETHEKFSFGLPYQVAASGKPVVVVIPLLSSSQGLGHFRQAAVVESTLQAIQREVFKTFSIDEPAPRLGKVALAGYSFSTEFVAAFIRNNARHQFVKETLREVYLFDPSKFHDVGNQAIRTAIAWAGPGARAIRVYSQIAFPAMADLVGGRVPQVPYARASARDPKRSAAFLPFSVWGDAQRAGRFQFAFNALGEVREAMRSAESSGDVARAVLQGEALARQLATQAEYDKENVVAPNYFDVHFMIPAMMLTDALRRSDLT